MSLTEPITSTAMIDILNKVDLVIHSMVMDGYAALAMALKTPLALVFTIYVAFVGWSILQGWSKLSVGQATKHVLKIAVVMSLVLEWSFFSKYIYEVFTNGPNEISAVMMNAFNGSTSGTPASVNSGLQTIFNRTMDIGTSLWAKGGLWQGLILNVMAICIFAMAIALAAIALVVLVTAKFSLSILLVLAPVFVPLLLWQSTKGIFEAWLKFSLGFALVPLFATTALMLGNQLMDMGVTDAETMLNSGVYTVEANLGLALGLILTFVLLLKSSGMAAGIAGGINVSALGAVTSTAMLASRLTGATALAGGAVAGAKSLGKQGLGYAGKGVAAGAKAAGGAAFSGAKAVYKKILRK